MSYRTFFGLAKEPFAADLELDAILTTAELLGVQERLEYAVRLGAIALVTGEVGARKINGAAMELRTASSLTIQDPLDYRFSRIYPGNLPPIAGRTRHQYRVFITGGTYPLDQGTNQKPGHHQKTAAGHDNR